MVVPSAVDDDDDEELVIEADPDLMDEEQHHWWRRRWKWVVGIAAIICCVLFALGETISQMVSNESTLHIRGLPNFTDDVAVPSDLLASAVEVSEDGALVDAEEQHRSCTL